MHANAEKATVVAAARAAGLDTNTYVVRATIPTPEETPTMNQHGVITITERQTGDVTVKIHDVESDAILGTLTVPGIDGTEDDIDRIDAAALAAGWTLDDSGEGDGTHYLSRISGETTDA